MIWHWNEIKNIKGITLRMKKYLFFFEFLVFRKVLNKFWTSFEQILNEFWTSFEKNFVWKVLMILQFQEGEVVMIDRKLAKRFLINFNKNLWLIFQFFTTQIFNFIQPINIIDALIRFTSKSRLNQPQQAFWFNNSFLLCSQCHLKMLQFLRHSTPIMHM